MHGKKECTTASLQRKLYLSFAGQTSKYIFNKKMEVCNVVPRASTSKKSLGILSQAALILIVTRALNKKVSNMISNVIPNKMIYFMFKNTKKKTTFHT